MEDRKLLARKDVNGRMRFAIVYRVGLKEIIINNLKLLELLIQILTTLKSEKDFKSGYLHKVDMLEDDDSLYENRRELRQYFRSLHHHLKNHI